MAQTTHSTNETNTHNSDRQNSTDKRTDKVTSDSADSKQHIRSFNKKAPTARPAYNKDRKRSYGRDSNNGSSNSSSYGNRGRGGNRGSFNKRGYSNRSHNSHDSFRRSENHRSQPPTETAPVHSGVPPIEPGVVRVIPLGGVEQIGKNMTTVEYGDTIIVVDAGFAFSDESTPGIDYILPNTVYLEENKHKVKAVVITHGHLDHIGGLPFIMDRIGNPPLYTREFGALLIKKRQEEFPDKPDLDVRIVTAKEGAITIDENLKVRFFGLTHSIPDSTGVIIETPFGDIVNTGDVRVENHDGVPIDREIEYWKMFEGRNVMLMTCDSTNIDSPGWSLSEDVVANTVDGIIKDAGGRIIIATFASQVERIICFLNSAKKYNKKVVIEGRSMRTNVGIIEQLELTDVSHIIPDHEMSNYAPDKIMILATGAQGEEFAALMRIANKTHKSISLNYTDTVVLSSSVIPGNEKSVTKLKDELYRSDAKVITYRVSDVHASGHGYHDELKWIHSQVQYKYFMPVHGYHYKLKIHEDMAVRELGVPKDNVVVPNNGSVIELFNEGNDIRVRAERAPYEDVYVEGGTVSNNTTDVVMRDRKTLSEDGIIVIINLVNTRNGRLRKSPDIASRGFVYLRDSQELLHGVRNITRKVIEHSNVDGRVNFDSARKEVSHSVGKFLFQKTGKRPIVVTLIIGI